MLGEYLDEFIKFLEDKEEISSYELAVYINKTYNDLYNQGSNDCFFWGKMIPREVFDELVEIGLINGKNNGQPNVRHRVLIFSGKK